jgi:hypothetical protein
VTERLLLDTDVLVEYLWGCLKGVEYLYLVAAARQGYNQGNSKRERAFIYIVDGFPFPEKLPVGTA